MNTDQTKCEIVERMPHRIKPMISFATRGLIAFASLGCLNMASGQAPATPPAAPATPAAAPADLNMEAQAARLQTEAFAAFTEGKFTDALAKAAEIRKLVNDKPFPQILYLEGACYFNMNDHVKAAETLQSYIDRFPDGEAIVDVKMALGRSLIQKGEADKGVTIL